ncbi:hypothetical protein ACFSOZ_25955 [Mesorhizobium newzealandense]|uniref:DUF768 domain-containing protein n=1 Tax=Mesorhizobium newzealandense TaxID=1300302 RepID=A0ABW4UFZ6_9HYPH
MVGFPDGHERLCAIEWLVQRLAVEHCLRTPNPAAAADRLKAEGEEYGMLVMTSAINTGVAEQGVTGVEISAALATLLEHIPDDVRAAL